jgi:hypothetical protein
MLTSTAATVTAIPILELREFSKFVAVTKENDDRYCAGFSEQQMDKAVCEFNADIYGKGFSVLNENLRQITFKLLVKQTLKML